MMTATMMMMMLRWMQSIIFVKGKIRCRLLTVYVCFSNDGCWWWRRWWLILGTNLLFSNLTVILKTHPKNLMMFERDMFKKEIFKPVC